MGVYLVEVGDPQDELGSLDGVADAGVGADEAGGVVVGGDSGVYEAVDGCFGGGGPVAGVASLDLVVGVDDEVDVGALEGGDVAVAGDGPGGVADDLHEFGFAPEVQGLVGVDEFRLGGEGQAPGLGAVDAAVVGVGVGERHWATAFGKALCSRPSSWRPARFLPQRRIASMPSGRPTRSNDQGLWPM